MSTILQSGIATENPDINFITSALLSICQPEINWDLRKKAGETVLSQKDPGQQIYTAMLCGKRHDALLATECQTVYDNAKLTPRQASVLQMKLSGYTFEEIGERRGSSKQSSQNIFLQAVKKIARALHVYPYAGLADVYNSETRRGTA
ncbi:hypothetical protein BH11ARM1_BH11ARM1_18010 [soil metagenome]